MADNKNVNLYDLLEEEILNADLSEREKNTALARLVKARGQKINLMLVGATGSGKSSTINAIFDTKAAKVGVGVDPETKDIECYQLENLTIWDTPGVGDSAENDEAYVEQIVRKLSEIDEDGVPIIDLVMIVVDGSTRDLSSVYDLISNVIVPALSIVPGAAPDNADRILIAVNQADMGMKGNHWDRENNCPDEVLDAFLKEKCASIRRRVLETTGIDVEPLYYCAGYTDENEVQNRPYNLTKLLYHIVTSLPVEKRIAIVENLNTDNEMWEDDDDEADYEEEIAEEVRKSVGSIVMETAGDFFEKAGTWGGMVGGVPLGIVTGMVGGIVGAAVGLCKALLKR